MTPDKLQKFLAKSRRSREAAIASSAQIDMELVRFDSENAAIDFNVDWSQETVWATQKQMSELFGKDTDTVGHHIAKLYDDGELSRPATTAKFAVVRLEGGRRVSREIEHYNLDVVLTVGYRVSSAKAVEFRKWANGVLKGYITDGFALNESRLRDDPAALRDLAAKVRALRSEERNIYAAVRDCFKEVAVDYDKASQAARSFYARVQDRFLFAATGRTAAQILLERADGRKPNMGVTSLEGRLPKKADATVAKNFLFKDELYVLHLMCEQFLLFAESKALRGQALTMKELTIKLDQLFAINEYPVFNGYGDYLREKAKEHAEIEWHLLMERVAAGLDLPAGKH